VRHVTKKVNDAKGHCPTVCCTFSSTTHCF